jgi:hypothetical protein
MWSINKRLARTFANHLHSSRAALKSEDLANDEADDQVKAAAHLLFESRTSAVATDRNLLLARPPVLSTTRVKENWFLGLTKHGAMSTAIKWNSSCAHGSSARAGLCWCCPRLERWSTDLAPLAVPIYTHAAIHLTGKDGNVLPAVPTIHQLINRARIFHSHGARHGQCQFFGHNNPLRIRN